MILADTSVWIELLRRGDPHLRDLLQANRVICHPHVIGELALGNLKNRRAILDLLQALPAAPLATDEEVHFFIEQHKLMGKGIGSIDAHLLTSVALAKDVRLWTRDKLLDALAERMNLGCTSL